MIQLKTNIFNFVIPGKICRILDRMDTTENKNENDLYDTYYHTKLLISYNNTQTFVSLLLFDYKYKMELDLIINKLWLFVYDLYTAINESIKFDPYFKDNVLCT